METVGIFQDIETANKAVDELLKDGFAEETITSLTSIPYPNGVLVETNQRTWFRWFSLVGGMTGAVAGFVLAAGTAWQYPVQTGDKPIIALFPTGIVTFEVTMLFAIIGAIVGMFIEMRLPPRRPGPYDPSISEGNIGISMAALTGHDRAEKIMRETGAIRIVTEKKQ